MKFWSDVEKEYNELLGDAPNGNGDDKDPDSSVGEFNDLLSDIKKDVKKIPKSEVFPSFTPDDKGEENSREDESDMEQEGGRRTYSRKSKKNKKCAIGGKTYEVGERWKDEKTGKDMMCILMNVPKSVQPLLADVDILSTKASAENETEWKRPSVEPQWSYTATPKRKDECQEVPSKKPSEKPDKIETVYGEGEKSSKYQTESNEDQEKELDAPDVAIEEEQKESKESSEENKTEKTDKEPQIIVVDPPKPEQEDAENNSEDDDRFENDNKSTPDVTETKEKEAEKKASDEEGGDSSDSEMEQDKPKITKADEAKANDNSSSTPAETTTESSDKSSGVMGSLDHPGKQTNENDKGADSDESNDQDISKDNKQDIPVSQENEAKEEKGEPIYTKETVVVQRKLIKTEKTIETTETEKNKK